jgi:DnaJ-class molecular chaperone
MGFSAGDTLDETSLKKGFRNASMEFHPDRAGEDNQRRAINETIYKQLTDSYAVLKDYLKNI